MKKPKKNQKSRFTRRQFVGGMAASASLVSIAPYISLLGCDPSHTRNLVDSMENSRPAISTIYDKGKIRITVDFSKPKKYKKKLKIKNADKAEFELIKINKTGSLNKVGLPELPYLGLLVHMPDFLLFDDPVEAVNSLPVSYSNFPVYPAQVDVQDNERYLKNYSKKADVNGKLYGLFEKLLNTTSPKFGTPIEEDAEDFSVIFPENIIGWKGPYYLGASRFYVLEIVPFYFCEVAVGTGTWVFKKSIIVDINNISEVSDLQKNRHFDTPFLPVEFDRLPKYERIIDPWYNPNEFNQILPDQLTNPVEKYRVIGPDLIIFYQLKEKISDKMNLSAKRLLHHKKNHGFPNAVMAPVENPETFSTDEELKRKIIEIIRANEKPVGSGDFEIWRLNSIIILGDIPGIKNIDLFQNQYGQLDDYYKDGNEKRNFYSDFCVSTPRNEFAVKDRWPDIAIGRIPAKSITEANLVIDNIIDYETNDYQDQIYKNLTLASYFQDRGPGSQELDKEAAKDYLQCVEEIRLNLESYTKVEMVYQTENPEITVSEHKYRDGTDLDNGIEFLETAEAKKKIVNSLRDGGRFIVHRDHGWMNGWAHPNFKIPDTWKVQIDPDCKCEDRKPSIVFNMNCLSGRFTGEYFENCTNENEDKYGEYCYKLPKPTNDCFSEALLKGTILPDGSRLNLKCPAVIASTEVSPSFENDWLLKIMFDLIYGGILTGKPKEESEMGKQTLGSIMNTAKMLLRAYYEDRGMHLHENIVFHILGDPTLKI